MVTRREILQRVGLGVVATGLPGLSLGRAETDSRFVLIILRGALDGLALAPPYGDGKYSGIRGELALGRPGNGGGVSKLDGLFGLHPAMPNTFDLYRRAEAAVIHAVASPYRSRSHFDGQDVLESGASGVGLARDGWLNRALGNIVRVPAHEIAIALAQNTPLVLRGTNSTTSWAPSQLPEAGEDTIRRIQELYAEDEFFASRLAQALASREIAGELGDLAGSRRNNELQEWKTLAGAAARFLTSADGPQIAVMETGGWDTHSNQGTTTGYLANRLEALDSAIEALQIGLGERWKDTVVTIVTEFGRTVAANGTRGTDHGTASAALVLGGAVSGGKVFADWPGLAASDLFEGRDLYPTTDLRSVFKAVLQKHLGVADSQVEEAVFPGSRQARPLDNLIRA